jgi:small acid-soluble spore protein I (minor)
MENIDIRNYIIENFKDDNEEKIRDSIETTIKFKDEDALIGLGVLFELLWEGSKESEKDNYLKIIMDKIKPVI